MGLRIQRNAEIQYLPIFEGVIEDHPGGGIIAIADIPTTTILLDRGVVVGVDSNGLFHVVKTAEVQEDVSSGNDIKVLTNEEFKVGDFISNGTISSAITAIDITSSDDYHTITVTSGFAVNDGDVLYQSTSEGLDAADVVIKYTPFGMTKNQMELTSYTSGTGATRQENVSSAIVVRGTVNESILPYPVTDGIKTSLTARMRFK